MTQNPYKKEFAFEKKFYKVVDDLILEDQKLGRHNFGPEYYEMYMSYRNHLNYEFSGDEIRMIVERRKHGTAAFKAANKVNTNFGNIWEDNANDYASIVRDIYAYKAWPREITNFPDFCEGYNKETKEYTIPGDYKSIRTSICKDTKANRTSGKPIGKILEKGGADLYSAEEYKKDIETYKLTGVLSDHLRALIVCAVYDYEYKDGHKEAVIYDVIVAPAICMIKFKQDGTVAIRKGKVQLSMHEVNIDNISQKNFGI
jgi:hypothetical protein